MSRRSVRKTVTTQHNPSHHSLSVFAARCRKNQANVCAQVHRQQDGGGTGVPARSAEEPPKQAVQRFRKGKYVVVHQMSLKTR